MTFKHMYLPIDLSSLHVDMYRPCVSHHAQGTNSHSSLGFFRVVINVVSSLHRRPCGIPFPLLLHQVQGGIMGHGHDARHHVCRDGVVVVVVHDRPISSLPARRSTLSMFGCVGSCRIECLYGKLCRLDATSTKGRHRGRQCRGGWTGVGTLAVQMAKRTGARVVGIAGGPNDKVEFLLHQVGVNAAVDYKDTTMTLEEQLAMACPDGIDFFLGQCWRVDVGCCPNSHQCGSTDRHFAERFPNMIPANSIPIHEDPRTI
jgi:Zinc-binding dehydrogenase